MRFTSALASMLLVSALLGITLAASFETGFFVQPVQHYLPAGQTFRQRYLVNSEFASGANPLTFLYLGPQGPVDPASITSGFVHDLAKEHGARLIALEHRLNGESYPVRSLETESMSSLTIDNAIADVSNFVRGYGGKGLDKVIAFGTEYGGTIAAFSRSRHSDVIHASVSASAIVGLTPVFTGYRESLTRAIATSWKGKSDCAGLISRALAYIDKLMPSDGRWQEHTRFGVDYKMCSRVPHYEMWTGEHVATVTSIVNEIDAKVNAGGIDELCNALVPRADEKEIWTLGRFIVNQLASTGRGCLDNTFDHSVAIFNSTRVADNTSGLRQQMYLACHETGTFPSLYEYKQYFYYQCAEAFGGDFKEYDSLIADGVKRINSEFRGRGTMYGGSKVFFTNSQVDSLSSPDISVLVDIPRSEVFALSSTGASRGAILGTATGGSLAEDRTAVAAKIAQWLGSKVTKRAVRRAAATVGPVSEELLLSLKL